MKILLHYPKWNNRWIPYFREVLSGYDLLETSTVFLPLLDELSYRADVLFSMWTNEIVDHWTHKFPDKKIITYLRRFELWEKSTLNKIDFNNIDAMIFVSFFIGKEFEIQHPELNGVFKKYLIPNGVDLDRFPLKSNKAGEKKIAFVGQLKHVKNFPLALQVLSELPEEYTLHHIGLVTSEQIAGQILSYTHSLGLQNRVVFYPQVAPDQMPEWYKDKDYILSTSINEGNPNCIIEAMAMGIKPIIHNWPGAREQFPHDLVFNTIDEAKNLIENKDFEPEFYRSWIEQRYSLDNFKRIYEVIEAL